MKTFCPSCGSSDARIEPAQEERVANEEDKNVFPIGKIERVIHCYNPECEFIMKLQSKI